MDSFSSLLGVILGSALTGAGASWITAYLSRPKTKAEVDASVVASDVSMSEQSRKWASDFAARAERAEQRADAAESRAATAERRIDALEDELATVKRDLRDAEIQLARMRQEREDQ